MKNSNGPEGLVCTFYSYKGGVGRSMALANVGAVLSSWGHRVLLIDWDLEAPGLERYFSSKADYVTKAREETPGILDVVLSAQTEHPIDWHTCLIRVSIGQGTPLSLITAGQNNETYVKRLQTLDWERLFEQSQMGNFLENLRTAWIAEFDFVLIDSRTGITDAGGICTIHLPDVLILLFTTNNQSLDGIIDVAERARSQQDKLPFARGRMIAVPVSAHDESRTEYKLSNTWRKDSAKRLKHLFSDWLPSEERSEDALELLRIPHIPYWTFGEKLPVLEEGIADPSSLGFAYSLLARLVSTRFDWEKGVKSFIVTRPSSQEDVIWDGAWLNKHRGKAAAGLQKRAKTGFMELCFKPATPASGHTLKDLLDAAESAMIHKSGWPIGVVLQNGDDRRPRPRAEEILAEIENGEGRYDYWTLKLDGSFYLQRSLSEDRHGTEIPQNSIVGDRSILQVAEAFLYCHRLLTKLAVPPASLVRLNFRHGGLASRTLLRIEHNAYFANGTAIEDSISADITEVLGQIEENLVSLVKRVCAPLFELFDFAAVDDQNYERLVNNFRNGKAG